MFIFPKDDDEYHWTSHVKSKMVQYKLSKSLILRILRYPKRTELGIAPKTVAVMQTNINTKKHEEIWVMYREEHPPSPRLRRARKKLNATTINKIIHSSSVYPERSRRIIISAWRYPGVSAPGKKIFIPDEIMTEIEKWFKK